MKLFQKSKKEETGGNGFFSKHFKIRSSIYARVIYIIAILSVFLFASYGIIFKSVNENYLNKVIRRCGDNTSTIIEGALYHSMLKNDKSSLMNTLDIINTLPNVDEVNLYDQNENVVYSSYIADEGPHVDPECISCHSNFAEMFPKKEKAYRIIDFKSACNMLKSNTGHRQLLVRTPILNEKSCSYQCMSCT